MSYERKNLEEELRELQHALREVRDKEEYRSIQQAIKIVQSQLRQLKVKL